MIADFLEFLGGIIEIISELLDARHEKRRRKQEKMKRDR